MAFKTNSFEYVKFIEDILKRDKNYEQANLNDRGLVILALGNLCKGYRKLRKLAKNYVQDDCLENGRKLRDELKIEQWW